MRKYVLWILLLPAIMVGQKLLPSPFPVGAGGGGGGGGGTAVAPYFTTVTAQTSVSIAAATHNQGVLAVAYCFDNSTPRIAVSCDQNYTRDSSGNLVFTFSPAFTGLIEVGSGGGVNGSGAGNFTVASPTVVGNLIFATNTLGTAGRDSGIAVVGGGLSMSGALQVGSGSGVAGALDLSQGTLPSLATNSISDFAPASVTSYGKLHPGAGPSGANQFELYGALSSGVSTAVWMGFTSTNLTDSAGLVRGAAALGTASYVPFVASAGVLTSSNLFTFNGGTGQLFTSGGLQTNGNILSAGATTLIGFSGSTHVYAASDGLWRITNTAETAGATWDYTTDAVAKLRNRANSAYATLDVLGLKASGVAGFNGTCTVLATVVNGIITAC